MKFSTRHASKTSFHYGRRTREDYPLRLLVVRQRLGELSWVVKTITTLMEPVEVVQVSGLANALWRVGRERFDSVLLDLDPADRATIESWRRHIAEIAAIPVLDLNGDAISAPEAAEPVTPPAGDRSRRWTKADRRRSGRSRASTSLRAG